MVEVRPIPFYPNYSVTEDGIIINHKTDRIMSISYTYDGYPKVNLVNEDGYKDTLSVRHVVATVFVEPPDALSDSVILLNAVKDDVRSSNLVWRPSGFAWTYSRQHRMPKPVHWLNLEIADVDTGRRYGCVFDAAEEHGLLCRDIWRSTYTGSRCYPTEQVFRVIR